MCSRSIRAIIPTRQRVDGEYWKVSYQQSFKLTLLSLLISIAVTGAPSLLA